MTDVLNLDVLRTKIYRTSIDRDEIERRRPRWRIGSGNFSFLIMGKTKATNFLRLIAFGLVIIKLFNL